MVLQVFLMAVLEIGQLTLSQSTRRPPNIISRELTAYGIAEM